MSASVHLTILPGFRVFVSPAWTESTVKQAYNLTVYDRSGSQIELRFLSAHDLRTFLSTTRAILSSVERELASEARKRRRGLVQAADATPF